MFGDKELLAILDKLQPLQLPVNTLPHNHVLYKVRSSFYYVYVINWLYNYKGYLKLASEYFDVELFELELLDLVSPPPLDPSVLFINKLKNSILNQLTNGNKFQYPDFDAVIRKSFMNTPLGEDGSFDALPLLDRFEMLFVILSYFTGLNSFRNFLEKTPDLILDQQILKSTYKNGTREDLVLMFNGTKVYKKTIEFTEIEIPAKRKDSPDDPDTFFSGSFDIDFESVKFDVELWTLEEFDQFASKKGKSLKPLTNKEFQSNILQTEIKKRRIIQNRKKEYQMLNLMATRKKSSRLEARERQKQIEDEEEQEKRKREWQLAIELQTITKPLNYDSNVLSREERLKLRKLNTGHRSQTEEPESAPEEPELSEQTVETVEIAAEPEVIESEVQPQPQQVQFVHDAPQADTEIIELSDPDTIYTPPPILNHQVQSPDHVTDILTPSPPSEPPMIIQPEEAKQKENELYYID